MGTKNHEWRPKGSPVIPSWLKLKREGRDKVRPKPPEKKKVEGHEEDPQEEVNAPKTFDLPASCPKF